jgi:hypothetical protein
VVIIGSGEHGEHDGEYYIEVDDDDDHGHKKKKRKGKGKKNKKNKGSKKIYKHAKSAMYGVIAMKMLFDHFILKKLAFITFFTFLLSKISFILASLVALKQFFHTPNGHQRAESHKVEIIQIPIKKFKPPQKEYDFDESKFVPVTFPPELMKQPTRLPYFTYATNQNDFISSEEGFDNHFRTKFTNDDVKFSNDDDDDEDENGVTDRMDEKTHNEKSYYKNHVHSPFV